MMEESGAHQGQSRRKTESPLPRCHCHSPCLRPSPITSRLVFWHLLQPEPLQWALHMNDQLWSKFRQVLPKVEVLPFHANCHLFLGPLGRHII